MHCPERDCRNIRITTGLSWRQCLRLLYIVTSVSRQPAGWASGAECLGANGEIRRFRESTLVDERGQNRHDELPPIEKE
jgi:hypothetical protein